MCHFSLRACFFLAFEAVVVLVVSPAAAAPAAPSLSLSCTASAASSAAAGVCNLARRRVSKGLGTATASLISRNTMSTHTPSSAFWSRQQLEVASSRSQWPPLNSPPLQLLPPEQPSVRALWLPRLEAAACVSSSQAAPTLLIQAMQGRGNRTATGSEIDPGPLDRSAPTIIHHECANHAVYTTASLGVRYLSQLARHQYADTHQALFAVQPSPRSLVTGVLGAPRLRLANIADAANVEFQNLP